MTSLPFSFKQPLRFASVGALNTLVDVLIYLILVRVGWRMLFANTVSTSFGMLLSFTLNRTFTFKAAAGKKLQQLTLFALVTFTSQWALQPIIIIFVSIILRKIGIHDNILIIVSKLVGVSASLVWNYTLYRRYVFALSSEGLKQGK